VNAQLGEVDSVRHDGKLVLRLSGEFDLSNVWKLRDALLQAIREERGDITVDLAAVRFMDAQLLRQLINARSAASVRGMTIRIVPPTDPDVWRVARLIDFPVAA
jgi:anti-anti-sigma factor